MAEFKDPEEEKLEKEELKEVEEERKDEPLEEARARAELEKAKAETEYYKAQRKAQKTGGAGKKHGPLYYFFVLIIALVIIWVLISLFYGPIAGIASGATSEVAGTQAGSEIAGVGAETKVGFMNTWRSAKGPINAYKQAMTIGSAEAWDAQELSSDLVVKEDAGVYLKELYANPAAVGNEIKIEGTLAAISTFEDQNEVRVCISIDPTPPYPAETDKELKDGWTCTMNNIKGEECFYVDDKYDQEFTCTHPPLSENVLKLLGVEAQFRELIVTIKLTHKANAVAFKNLYVTDIEKYRIYAKDSPEELGATVDSARPYAATDKKTIDFSIGLFGEDEGEEKGWIKKTFRELIGDFDPSGSIIKTTKANGETEDEYLGVNFAPKGEGDLRVTKLELTLPSHAIDYEPKNSQFKRTGKPFSHNGNYPYLQKYTSQYVPANIESGESESYYLNFFVYENYLGSKEVRNEWEQLTARADIEYDYTIWETITVRIKRLAEPKLS